MAVRRLSGWREAGRPGVPAGQRGVATCAR